MNPALKARISPGIFGFPQDRCRFLFMLILPPQTLIETA